MYNLLSLPTKKRDYGYSQEQKQKAESLAKEMLALYPEGFQFFVKINDKIHTLKIT